MLRVLLSLIFGLLSPVRLSATLPYPTGPVTDYTRWLEREERHYTPGRRTGGDTPYTLQCYRHPDRPFYIGTKAVLPIKAPIADVQRIFEDVAGYPDIFFGFEGIKLTGKTDEGFVVAWHRPVPVFFIPDLRYEVVYRAGKTSPTQKILRFQMKEKVDLLKGLDGMIVLEATGDKTTLLTQYLFLDGRYGPLETFDPGKIWTDGVRDFSLANLGVKTRAENPKLERGPLRAAIEKAYSAEQVETCIATKTLHPGLKTAQGETP